MPTLSKELRRTLENVVADARRIAEAGAEQALKQLAVHHSESWSAMTTEEKALREKLRAHGKQLGDQRGPDRTQEIRRLIQACAYEHWHRMLFARFLAENNLLIHPEYAEPISLDEVKGLAREQNADWLSIAASFAQQMLLEVFRPDDPVLSLRLPPETRQKLEEHLASLPLEIFTAEDSLGWVYQFWQRDQKDAVNRSEVKIGADELPSVTQLFTEDYMVLFLLHNTLGAWWTAKRHTEGKDTVLPDYEWTYLHLNEDGTPTAGTYTAWPRSVRDLRLLDPCMGSGHFLTFALPILARMRAEEEGVTLSEAIKSVLEDNLFGLELDARCSQIAAFNLALSAWHLVGSHFELRTMNLACSGLGINASKESWTALAGNSGLVRDTLAELYSTFQKAPTLGSLIDPTRFGQPLLFARFEEVWPALERALAAEQTSEETRELAVAAQGVLSAARILATKFTLVATNVPYLGRGKQDAVLLDFCGEFHSDAKADLATCFVDRTLRLCAPGGTSALVSPQNWLYQVTYADFVKRLIASEKWGFVVRLGPKAFQTPMWDFNVMLLAITHTSPPSEHSIVDWNVAGLKTAAAKAAALREAVGTIVGQARAFTPDMNLSLGRFARCYQGISTGDNPRWLAEFWEVNDFDKWSCFQTPSSQTAPYGGRTTVVRSAVTSPTFSGGAIRGAAAWGKRGVAVARVGSLHATLYSGDLFSNVLPVIIPNDEAHLPAIWAFAESEDFDTAVRGVNQALNVDNGYFEKAPFNLDYWQQVAEEKYPNGLPTPHSEDATQWLFAGNPKNCEAPLQAAVARVVGFSWPLQRGVSIDGSEGFQNDGLEVHTDSDGIVCLNSIGGEMPAADRVRALLADAYGSLWSAALLSDLLGGWSSLEDWLRDGFFEQHCEMFGQRPFIWQVWDGRKDGFHALVSYHQLAGPRGEAKKTLEKLIYTALGDWISRQRAEVVSGAEGADARLAASMHLQSELEKILAGENPYDIFVRWKPIHEQPMGWEPDLNDGVRLNIRPWLTATLAPHTKPKKGACILRVTPKIAYGRDRGKEPSRDNTDFPWFTDSTDRDNDVHLGLDEKRKARERRKK